jgi:hypothetical protein
MSVVSGVGGGGGLKKKNVFDSAIRQRIEEWNSEIVDGR